MRVGVETFCAPFGGAALEVGDLLNTDGELRFPSILGNVDIFAVEDFVDGVGTVVGFSQRCAVKPKRMMSPLARRLKKVLNNLETHLQAVPSLT